MWDLPGPGLEPVSPALAGGFLTTAPPGTPGTDALLFLLYSIDQCQWPNLESDWESITNLLGKG